MALGATRDAEKAAFLEASDALHQDVDDVFFDEPEPRPSRTKAWLTTALLATGLILLKILPSHYDEWMPSLHHQVYKPACPQEHPLVPTTKILESLEAVYVTETFQNRSAAWLSGAVQIPCVGISKLLLAYE